MADQEYLFVKGRLVQGDIFTPQTKNMNGGPLVNLRGEPKVQYFIAVAASKTDPDTMPLWNRIQEIGKAGFPNGQWQSQTFAWKVLDGDAPEHAAKTGFAGCFVFRLSSGFPITAWTKGGERQITDPNEIKRGYYVRVAFTATANGNHQKPGVYLNPYVVELIGYGEEIQSGPNGAAIFGSVPAATLPQGASPTPVAAGPMPGLPGAGPTPVAAGPMPEGASSTPAPVPPGIVPAPDFLNPPVMTAKAGGASYQQFIDQGWTKELLIQHGYMEA